MKIWPSLIAILLLAPALCAEVLYDFEQAFFIEDFGVKCKDHALVHHEGTYHLYYIQGYPNGPVPPLGLEQWLGHATSPDLRHWTRRDSILPVVPGTWESGFIWAPHVVEDPDGGWLMFYTGADDSPEVRQRTGIAHSDDLYTWERWEGNPAYEPGEWTDWADPLLYADCRDPFIFQAPGDTLYYMLNTVREASGNGAIDLAVSEDLYSWAHQDTFSRHTSANMLESVCLWEDEAEKWHFFFTKQNYPGTYHVVALDPFGPFLPGAAGLFDAGYGAEVTDVNGQAVFSRFARVPLLDGDRYFIRFDEMLTPPWGGDLPRIESAQGYRDWWAPQFGTAFDNQPTWGDNPHERGEESSNLEGNSYVSTLELFPYPGFANPGRSRGFSPQGLLKSDAFVVEHDRIGLLVGGGDQDSTCFVALVRDSDKRLLFRETGADEIGMDPRLWNTETIMGETVFLAVSDLSSLGQGYISVDTIREYDRVGDDPIAPADPMVEDVFLGDLVSAAGVVWNCDFSASIHFGPVPLYVVFTDLSEGEAEIYEWDFEADGIVDKYTRDAAHSFQQPGLYTVRHRVVNGLGMEAVEEKVNYINVLEDSTNVLIFPGKISSGAPTPISFGYSGMDSLGSFSAQLDFDSTKIAFAGIDTWIEGREFEATLDGERVLVEWSDETGIDPIEPETNPLFLFGLKFNAVVAVDTTQITFVDSLCVLTDAAGDTIQDMGWIDTPPFGEVILEVTSVVTGQTSYYNDDEPVGGVRLSMGPPNEDAISNLYGEFEFEPYPRGDYVLRVSKDDDLLGSNSLDAVKLMRHHRGVEILEGVHRLRAGDVNLDAQVDSLDAWAVAEAAAGLSPLPSGDWAFDPDSVVFEPLGQDTHQLFTCIRMGDVNGGWPETQAGRSEESENPREDLVLSLPDTVMGAGDPQIAVPLLASGLIDLSAISLRIAFADTILTFQELSSPQPGLEFLVGEESGLVSIEWFDSFGGDSLFSQVGDTLLYLTFAKSRTEWHISPLDFAQGCELGDSLGDPVSGVSYLDGSLQVTSPSVDVDPAIPGNRLLQNHPNPFNPSTEIRFSLADPGPLSLKIYDLSGRLVRHLLVGERYDEGQHRVEWNGRDQQGRQVSSGVYFYRLETREFKASRKMLLLR